MICSECQFEEGHSLECSKYTQEIPPMGLSNWRRHGIVYGYYAYFEQEIRKKIAEELDKLV
jgi:hypothetical protein